MVVCVMATALFVIQALTTSLYAGRDENNHGRVKLDARSRLFRCGKDDGGVLRRELMPSDVACGGNGGQ